MYITQARIVSEMVTALVPTSRCFVLARHMWWTALAQAAHLGLDKDAAMYKQLAANESAAFHTAFYNTT